MKPSPPKTSQLLLLLLFLLTQLPTATSTCYLPNGTAHDDLGAQPCSPDPTNPLSTICCHTKWKNPPGSDIAYGSTADECLPNGLCQNRGFSSINGTRQDPWIRYYRVYCTHEDWKSGACLDVCDTGRNKGDVAQMTPCDGTNSSSTWCCGNTTACCTPSFNPDAVSIARLFQGLAASSVSSARASTALPSFSTTAGPSSPGRLSHQAIVGVSVGVVVGVLGAFGSGCYLARRRLRRIADTPALGPGLHRGVDDSSARVHEMDASYYHELDSEKSRSELK